MKVMVTGASGLLGREVVSVAQERQHEVSGWSLDVGCLPDGTQLEVADLGEVGTAEAAVSKVRPDLIIHCAAATDADSLERAEDGLSVAKYTNSYLPLRLGDTAKKRGVRFVHVSTDGIYDGDRPGLHEETEKPRPVNLYARSKTAGEWLVQSFCPAALIVRVAVVGWTLPGQRPKLAERIFSALTTGYYIELWKDQVFSPLAARDLAELLLDASETSHAGILNLGSARPISQAGLGVLIANALGADPTLISPVPLARDAPFASRPSNTALDVRRAEAILRRLMPTVGDAVERLCIEWTTKMTPRQVL